MIKEYTKVAWLENALLSGLAKSPVTDSSPQQHQSVCYSTETANVNKQVHASINIVTMATRRWRRQVANATMQVCRSCADCRWLCVVSLSAKLMMTEAAVDGLSSKNYFFLLSEPKRDFLSPLSACGAGMVCDRPGVEPLALSGVTAALIRLIHVCISSWKEVSE